MVGDFLREDRNEEALKLIEKSPPGHGGNGYLFYLKAMALKNQGLYERALEELEKSIKLGYPEAASYNLKAFILGEYLKDYEGEIFYASKSLSLDPFDTEAYFMRARAYAETGREEKALADLNSAVKIDPSDYSLLPERAGLLTGLGKYPEAVSDLKKALLRYPENPEIWFGLYKAYKGAGLRSNAIYCVSRAVSASPETADYLEERAFFLEELGDYSGACEDMGKAAALRGKEISSYDAYFLSKQLYRLNRQKEALEYAELAMAKTGADLPLLYDLRGRINFQEGRVKEALKDWKKSADLGYGPAGEKLAHLVRRAGSGK